GTPGFIAHLRVRTEGNRGKPPTGGPFARCTGHSAPCRLDRLVDGFILPRPRFAGGCGEARSARAGNAAPATADDPGDHRARRSHAHEHGARLDRTGRPAAVDAPTRQDLRPLFDLRGYPD